MHMKTTFLILLSLCGVLAGCEVSAGCTDIYLGYTLRVQRPLNVAADEVDQMMFETCIDGACASESPLRGELSSGTSRLTGSVRENQQGFYFDGSVGLGESSGTTHVSVRAVDASGAEQFYVEGDVTWHEIDDGCHTAPNRDAL